MQHRLKIESAYFEAVIVGDKTFEIRYNDRGFQKGDSVILEEVDEDHNRTGRLWVGMITYVSTFMQKENWCVLAIGSLSEEVRCEREKDAS